MESPQVGAENLSPELGIRNRYVTDDKQLGVLTWRLHHRSRGRGGKEERGTGEGRQYLMQHSRGRG
eukprot:767773-Hanusia_phi.AAC.3